VVLFRTKLQRGGASNNHNLLLFKLFIMANYATSILTTAQAMLGKKYNEAELRRKIRPAIQLAVKNQDFAIPNHQALKTADSRPVDVMYFVQRAPGAATAKVAKHTGTKADSGKVTLAYVRFAETFRISRKQAQNNVVGFQDMFNNELQQAILNVLGRMESSAIAYLVANRCQLAAPVTSGAGTWNVTNFALEIAAGNKARFAQFAKSFMQGRFYRGDMDVISDLAQYREYEFQAAQGAGNSINESFQFQGMNIAPTTDVILAAYTAGSALYMPAGTFAGLVWNDPENRKGTDDGNNNVGMLGTLLDPFGSTVVFDVSKWTDRADESAAGGNVQDIKDEWEISATVGWALPPLSLASDSAVHLIAQA
jgi:hypothetical protein